MDVSTSSSITLITNILSFYLIYSLQSMLVTLQRFMLILQDNLDSLRFQAPT